MALLLDGQKLSLEVLSSLRQRINPAYPPKMAIILCGDDPASKLYTSMKKKRGEEIGVKVELINFSKKVSSEKVIRKIQELNQTVDGIIVQLPLPKHLPQDLILNSIDPAKDIDGLTTQNLGNLVQGKEFFVPATPKGVMRLLEKYNLDLSGKEVVIINRSNIVGKPLASLFLNRNATVTVCHRQTQDLIQHTRRADILVSGVGIPDFIKLEMIKEGAVVIDVGIAQKNGKVCGDVDFEKVKEKASYLTPVPGGVGPMTVAMLLETLVNGG